MQEDTTVTFKAQCKLTLAPASASARAASYPIPPEPPVMIATLPVMSNIFITLFDSVGDGVSPCRVGFEEVIIVK